MITGKYISILVILTCAMLGLVHREVALIETSYSVNSKKQKVEHLLEENKKLRLKLLSLAAPSALEEKLLSADVKLTYPEKISIVRIPSALSKEPLYMAGTDNFNLLRKMGFVKEARAEGID